MWGGGWEKNKKGVQLEREVGEERGKRGEERERGRNK